MKFNWETMVRCSLRNLLRGQCFSTTHTSGSPFWFAVAELFGLGSTSAHELCRLYGIDPNQKMPESELDEVARKCSKEMEDQNQGPSETCCKMWEHIGQAASRN